jgi:hypothetical protein
MHRREEASYNFRTVFSATTPAGAVSSGELTEIWINGRRWRWTVSEDDFEHTRLLHNGELLEDHHATALPLRGHMLRNQLYWAVTRDHSIASIRTARTIWHGAAVLCIFTEPESAADASAPQSGGRNWNEEEYCVDDANRLVVYSPAPGSYTEFSYDAAIDFHGKRLADRLVTFVNGVQVIAATFQIADATQADADSLSPASGMTSSPAPATLGGTFLARWELPAGEAAGSGRAIVHASIDADGNVAEAEIASSSGAAFSSQALGQIIQRNFGRTSSMRLAWVEVVSAPAGSR